MNNFLTKIRYIWLSALMIFILSANQRLFAQCNPPTSATVVTSNSTCINNGSISLTNLNTGGNGNAGSLLEFAITSSSNPSQPLIGYQNDSTFNDLYPGSYTISIRWNCSGTFSPAYTKTATVGGNYVALGGAAVNILASFCNNGGFTFNTTGGYKAMSGSYRYQLVSTVGAPQPDPGALSPVQTSNVFSGLAPGTYYVRIVDDCSNYITRQVTVPTGTVINPFNATLSCVRQFSVFTKEDFDCGDSSVYYLNRSQLVLASTAFNNSNTALAGKYITYYPDGTTDTLFPATIAQMTQLLTKVNITSMINANLFGDYYMKYIDACGNEFTSMKVAYAPPVSENVGRSPTVVTKCGQPYVTFTSTATTLSTSGCTGCADNAATAVHEYYPFTLYHYDNLKVSIDNGVTWHNSNDTIPLACGPVNFNVNARFQYCGITQTSTACGSTAAVAACNNTFPAKEVNNYACEGNSGIFIQWRAPIANGETFKVDFLSVPAGQAPIPQTTANYQFTLPGMTNSSGDSKILDLKLGKYVYKITDACNNVYLDSITLVHPHAYAIDTIVSKPSCNNADITVNLTNNPFTDGILGGGVVSYFQRRNVYKVELLNANNTVVQTVLDTLGNIAAFAPFNDNGSVVNSSVNFLGIPAGTYTVRLTSNFSGNSITTPGKPCPVTQTVVVPEYNLSALPSLFLDCGGNNGAISVVTDGGVGPFTYHLYQGTVATGTFVATQTTPLFTGLNSGLSYTMLVDDACGTGITVSKSFSPYALNIQQLGLACIGESLTLFTDSVPGATYSWEKDGVALASTTSSITISPFSVSDYGIYTAKVSVAGCSEYTATKKTDPSSCSFPVTLVNFDVFQAEDHITLKWTSSSESNTDRFEIERSADGRQYGKFGTVKSAENSTVLRNYTLNDPEPLLGANYYRLKMIDLDGTYAYSSIRHVSFKGNADQVALVYPNPARSELKISIQNFPNLNKVELYDMTGRKVMFRTVTSQHTVLNLNEIASGVYTLMITDQRTGQQYNKKVVIAK